MRTPRRHHVEAPATRRLHRAGSVRRILGSEATASLPWLSSLLSPDRWLLWLGVLFVLSVYYFPTGVVGRLRAPARGQQAPH